MRPPIARMHGVTLVEMAIVLLILGVLTKAVTGPLSALQKHRQHREAVSQLTSIQSALWAHVVSQGVLPCPVAAEGLTVLDRDTACGVYQGGVPAVTLGLSGSVTANGALLDPWNRPYQLALSNPDDKVVGSDEPFDWAVEGSASRTGIQHLGADIVVCNRSVSGQCPSRDVRADELSFVILTAGADDTHHGDQSENLDADQVFTLQEPSINAEQPFDDLLLWGTAAETAYWLLRAGWLP